MDEKAIKLNTNENPYPIPTRIAEKIKNNCLTASSLNKLRKYPPIDKSQLTKVIAKKFNLNSNQIYCGNGSDEIIGNIFRALVGSEKKVLLTEYTYSAYFSWAGQNKSIVKILKMPNLLVELEKLKELNFEVFFLVNPNAPTGILLPKINIVKIIQKYPKKLFIIDEAYIDFCSTSKKTSLVEEVNNYPNLIVLRTLSKGYSLAGIRFGYALAQEKIINTLKAISDPYNVNSLTQAIANLVFKNLNAFKKNTEAILKTKSSFCNTIEKMGFNTLPSESNFILTKPPERALPKKTAKSQKTLPPLAYSLFLFLKKNKIYVRYFSNGKLKDYLRITIGTSSQMDTMLKVIKKFYK